MSTETYRLVYFDVGALAEPIRMIFAYSGIPFVDERVPWDYPKWFKETKSKFSSTVGQMPVLYEKGHPELCQSQGISRYLAKKFDLVADNDWDNARLDEVISIVFDLFHLWRTCLFQRDPQQKKLLKSMLDARIELCYAKFSSILQERPGQFILGEKVTHADFWVANIISMLDNPLSGARPVLLEGLAQPSESDVYIGLTNKYPLLKQHKDAVENLPKIKEWIEKRPKTIF